ncbi:transporter [Luteolibacter flavescens]|uniref:Transporter n=1 Tax=Luteolibacter flavescens TaxID=1859460 RepID=A0ABT3FIU8_9BACT|nr:transporter [Luteolibacter flavescens]MCW1883494.1 transporter [Luteolibacter flavescens]
MTNSFTRTLSLIAISTPLAAVELRPLSTDRPDTTESPYTVDAGHFQFEMEVAAWTREGSADSVSLGELNAKFGLNTSTDLQVVISYFTHEDSGAEGFGDIQVRLKHNLWGNDEGSTALAVMPYLKLPTANSDLGNGKLEGGIIVPFAFDGPGEWGCAVMTQLDIAEDSDGSGYHAVSVNSVTASHAITENAAVFFELVGIFSADSDDHTEAYFNTGCTYALDATTQLDGGVRLGLTDASADVTPFLGLSKKF